MMGDVENLSDYRIVEIEIGKQVERDIRSKIKDEYRLKKIQACQKQLEELLAAQAVFEIQKRYPKLRKSKPAKFESLVGEHIALSFEKRAHIYREFLQRKKILSN